jgi:hypothetical protein
LEVSVGAVDSYWLATMHVVSASHATLSALDAGWAVLRNLPASQLLQSVCASSASWYSPVAQASQAKFSALDAIAALRNLPAAQLLQSVCASTSWYLPETQASQVSAPKPLDFPR